MQDSDWTVSLQINICCCSVKSAQSWASYYLVSSGYCNKQNIRISEYDPHL